VARSAQEAAARRVAEEAAARQAAETQAVQEAAARRVAEEAAARQAAETQAVQEAAARRVAEEAAARQAAEARAAQEAAARRVAEEAAARQAAEARAAQEAAARRAAEEAAARQAAEARAAQEAAARRAAEEAAARQAAEARAAQEAVARRAAEEAAARQAEEARAAQEAAARKTAEAQAAQETAVHKEEPSVPAAEAEGSKGMLMKAGIGVAVLLLLIGAYVMFGKKKEAPPAPELPKIETKIETKTETKADTEKQMDPAVREAKLKEYAEAVKAANEQKKQDAAANEKIVFLVEDVQRAGNDLVVSGHFYNGKKNRTITAVKALELDIVLRDMDKELLNEKNIKYDKSFTGMHIEPLKDSQVQTVNLQDKAPAAEFNNFTVTAHDVHWEAVGK
jgi:hypothetical protein